MGTKDITEKNLEALNDVFADIVNVLLFNGERLVHENELEEADTKSIFKADGKIHEQERDVSKFWKNGEIRLSILGFENQTKSDADMPLRVISYDGASYKQQLLNKKVGKRYPVATLVLYFGTKTKWTAPENLYDCFDIPKKLKPFVSNYKINVFNIAWLNDETIEMFQSDFKIVAKYFQTIRLKKDYTGSKEIVKHVDETLKMLSALTGDSSFESIYNESNLNERGVNMYSFVEKITNKGIAIGRKEGARNNAVESAKNLITMGILTPEQISTAISLPLDEVLQ